MLTSSTLLGLKGPGTAKLYSQKLLSQHLAGFKPITVCNWIDSNYRCALFRYDLFGSYFFCAKWPSFLRADLNAIFVLYFCQVIGRTTEQACYEKGLQDVIVRHPLLKK